MALVYDVRGEFGQDKRDQRLQQMKPLVRESWERCLKQGVDECSSLAQVLSPEEVKRRRDQHGNLLQIAKSTLERLYDSVRGYGFAILLLDADCCVLEVLGDPDFLEQHPFFRPGELWGEAYKGTNAMSLAQMSQKPQQVTAEEHFTSDNQMLTCSAAPIFEPNGRFIGVLDISGDASRPHSQMLGIAVTAARAIEEGLRLEAANQEVNTNMRVLRTVIEAVDEGVITVDRDGYITSINRTAFAILKKRWSDFRGKSAILLLPGHQDLLDQVLKQGCAASKSELLPDKTKRFLSGYPVMDQQQAVCGGVIVLSNQTDASSRLRRTLSMQPQITFDHMIGKSEKLRACLKTAKAVAGSSTSIYIEGESGTGKEILAQSIHNASPFAAGPFVAISCAAIPRTLIESELFGYEDGTFSGGKKGGKAGKFELANNGTLFLDEIADMPLDTQVSLLRVLQEKQVVRIGGYHPIPINIRVLSATNKNLEEEVARGNFRADLYYRLNVIKITLPPLRERGRDVLLLARHFQEMFSAQLGYPVKPLSPAVKKALVAYQWPGNVRELSNAMERVVNLTRDGEILTQHLPEALLEAGDKGGAPGVSDARSLQEAEKLLLTSTLEQTRGNITQCAQLLGISRSTLYRKMEKHQLKNCFGKK